MSESGSRWLVRFLLLIHLVAAWMGTLPTTAEAPMRETSEIGTETRVDQLRLLIGISPESGHNDSRDNDERVVSP